MRTPDGLIDEELTEEELAEWNTLPDDGEDAQGELGVTTVTFFPKHPSTPKRSGSSKLVQPKKPRAK